MQLAEANLATVLKYVEEQRAKELVKEQKAKEQQEAAKAKAILEAEAKAKAILEAEKALGIDICSNPSTKQQIKEYLTEIGVPNIQSLTDSQAVKLF